MSTIGIIEAQESRVHQFLFKETLMILIFFVGERLSSVAVVVVDISRYLTRDFVIWRY